MDKELGTEGRLGAQGRLGLVGQGDLDWKLRMGENKTELMREVGRRRTGSQFFQQRH